MQWDNPPGLGSYYLPSDPRNLYGIPWSGLNTFTPYTVPVHAPSRGAALGTKRAADPRMEFYDKFQREMEEHDQDFETKYDGDLDTTLIFVSVRSRAGRGVWRLIAWDLMLTIHPRSLAYSRLWRQHLSSTCNRSSSPITRK